MSGPTSEPSHAAADHGHAAHGHAAHGHEPHEEHIHPREHYIKVWGGLVVLFFISVLGPMLGIKVITLITAFGIACVKAGMVVKYFMHLDVEKRFVHYFLATSLVFMFLMFAGLAPDVMKHEGTRWVNVAAKAESARALAAGDEPHHGGAEHGGAEHGGAEHGGAEPAPAGHE